jgi:hypothetical protein
MAVMHLIARACAFAWLAAVATMARPAPPAPAPEPEPTYYICQVTRTSAFGSVFYTMNVPVDGSAPFHRVQWQIPERAEGLSFSVQWDGAAPVDGRLDGRAWFIVHFVTSRPVTRDARIEIRRMAGERYAAEFAYAGPYQRLQPWGNRGLHALETQGRWEELNIWLSGRDFLTFALVRRDGSVVAEDRLAAAMVAGTAGEIAAARRDTEARAADYRHQCDVPQPIVVT